MGGIKRINNIASRARTKLIFTQQCTHDEEIPEHTLFHLKLNMNRAREEIMNSVKKKM